MLSLLLIKCGRGFPDASVIQITPANAGDAGDVSLILGSERSPGVGTHSSILAWEIPWTEEPGGLQPMGSQRVGNN